MTDQPDKLDLRSQDLSEEKRQEILRLFPDARTEDGKIDFERLKLALGKTVDVGKERYGLNWPGKADCFKAIQTPSLGTLRPCPEESVSFDTTENLIIEGDNLEVLKLLQKSYLGKVKMIYIDPHRHHRRAPERGQHRQGAGGHQGPESAVHAPLLGHPPQSL
jgi:adenine-specific DNA-methyltransferase